MQAPSNDDDSDETNSASRSTSLDNAPLAAEPTREPTPPMLGSATASASSSAGDFFDLASAIFTVYIDDDGNQVIEAPKPRKSMRRPMPQRNSDGELVCASPTSASSLGASSSSNGMPLIAITERHVGATPARVRPKSGSVPGSHGALTLSSSQQLSDDDDDVVVLVHSAGELQKGSAAAAATATTTPTTTTTTLPGVTIDSPSSHERTVLARNGSGDGGSSTSSAAVGRSVSVPTSTTASPSGSRIQPAPDGEPSGPVFKHVTGHSLLSTSGAAATTAGPAVASSSASSPSSSSSMLAARSGSRIGGAGAAGGSGGGAARREYDLDDIVNKMMNPNYGLEIRDRRKGLRKLNRTMVGNEFLDWLIQQGFTASGQRSEAVAIATALLSRQLIKAATPQPASEHIFQDQQVLYSVPAAKPTQGSPVSSSRSRRDASPNKAKDKKSKKKLPKLFAGDTLEEIMTAEEPDAKVPRIFTALVDYIIEIGGETTDGIGRLSPEVFALNALCDQLEARNYTFHCHDAHLPMSALKNWLRDLKEPLWPNVLYNSAIKNAASFPALAALVAQLPPINLAIMEQLLVFCQRLGQKKFSTITRMNRNNLALVFAPCVFRCPSDNPLEIMTNSSAEHMALFNLVKNWDSEFKEADDNDGGEAS